MNRFYESVTKSICSTLNIVKVLGHCRSMLNSIAPIEGLFIGKYLHDKHRVVHLADVNSSTERLLDDERPVLGAYHDYLMSPSRPESRIWGTVDEFPGMKSVMGAIVPDRNPVLEMRLRMDGEHMAILGAYAKNKSDVEKLRGPLMDIREPISLCVANQLLTRGLLHPSANGTPGAQGSVLDDAGWGGADGLVWASETMKNLLGQVRRIAGLPSNVLLLGETGTGKNMVARIIHDLSPRRKQPFIHVNCGALTESLVDSELFGHERGAFTGATAARKGLFEQAHQGTIYLDEIGEFPLHMQPRLLQVLESRAVRRVGGKEIIPLDFRLIAATNQNLERMVHEGTFRRDLFYRLMGFVMSIPPLRERQEDIPVLASYLLDAVAARLGIDDYPRIDPNAMAMLCRYAWPGNVREMRAVIERALIMQSGDRLFFEPQPDVVAAQENASGKSLNDGMRDQILATLRETKGRINGPGGAANLLDVNPSTLRSRMKKLSIPFGRHCKAVY